MTRSAVTLRHISFEDLGLLEPLRRDRRSSFDYADIDGLNSNRNRNADLMVVPGDPNEADDRPLCPFLNRVSDVLKHRIDTGTPASGICLGAPIISSVSDTQVHSGQDGGADYGPLNLSEPALRSSLTGIGNGPIRRARR